MEHIQRSFNRVSRRSTPRLRARHDRGREQRRLNRVYTMSKGVFQAYRRLAVNKAIRFLSVLPVGVRALSWRLGCRGAKTPVHISQGHVLRSRSKLHRFRLARFSSCTSRLDGEIKNTVPDSFEYRLREPRTRLQTVIRLVFTRHSVGCINSRRPLCLSQPVMPDNVQVVGQDEKNLALWPEH
jgi:hypothetical protein